MAIINFIANSVGVSATSNVRLRKYSTFDEHFEVAVGCDEAGWTSTVGSGGTVNFDAATSDVSSPIGWESQCLKVVKTSGFTTYAETAALETLINGEIFYFRIEIVLTAETLSTYDATRFISFSNYNSGVAYFRIKMHQPDNPPYFRLQIEVLRDGDTNYTYEYLGGNFNLNQKYVVEVKWDGTNDVWAWKVDGVNQPNDVDSSDPITSEGTLLSGHTSNYKRVIIGAWGGDSAGFTVYCDNVAINKATWVGDEIPNYITTENKRASAASHFLFNLLPAPNNDVGAGDRAHLDVYRYLGDEGIINLLASSSGISITSNVAMNVLRLPRYIQPYLLFESFEATGYDNAGWTESVGGGNTVNEDALTSDVSNPTNWGSQCLKIVTTGSGDAYTYKDFGSSLAKTYLRVELTITAESLANYDEVSLLWWSNAYATAGDVMMLNLTQVGSGSLYFRCKSYHNGSANVYDSFNAVSLNTKYRFEFKWDATNDVWSWKIDGVVQANNIDATDPVTSEGTLTSSHKTGVQFLLLGGVGNKAYTCYYDLVAVSADDWIGTWVPTGFIECSTTTSLVTLLNAINFLASTIGISTTFNINMSVVRRLLASSNGNSNTSNIIYNVARLLLASSFGNANTSTINFNVARPIAALTQGTTVTSTFNALISRSLIAQAIGGSSTSLSLNVNRPLMASSLGSTITPDNLSLKIVRLLLANSVGNSNTSLFDLEITEQLIAFLASIMGQSITSNIILSIARPIVATATGQSATSPIVLDAMRKLVSLTIGQSNTSNINANILRNIAASATGNSNTRASLNFIWGFLASSMGASTTPNINLNVLRPLLSSANGNSVTSTVNLNVLRALLTNIIAASNINNFDIDLAKKFAAEIVASTTTSDIFLSMINMFAANPQGQTFTPPIQMLVSRDISAEVSARTATSDIYLEYFFYTVLLLANAIGRTQTSDVTLDIQKWFKASPSGDILIPDINLLIERILSTDIRSRIVTPDTVHLIVTQPVSTEKLRFLCKTILKLDYASLTKRDAGLESQFKRLVEVASRIEQKYQEDSMIQLEE